MGEPLNVGGTIKSRRNIIENTISDVEKIVLRYNENVFSIEFAALAYLDAEKMTYRYKLEGFNNKWSVTDFKDRKVTYTNLDPGEYVFKVQAVQGEIDPATNEARLLIIVKPPLWRTKVAIVFYFIFLVLILLLFRQFLIEKERLKFQREQAILETHRQQELNTLKTRFFTNVSHEFRTPLTLIMTPLERIIQKSENNENIPTLKLIFQNAKRLLYLVNQLLDFRKMEEQRISINMDYGDIIKFIDEIFLSFADLAESKKIIFTNKPFTNELFMRFDQDKLEKILFNLLSNAFKFTHESESISIVTELLPSGSPDSPIDGQPETLLIRVIDTGIGIPPDKHHKIFERFFQDDQPVGMLNKGSGIGLALTQEFVKLHGGVITLDSEVDKGSRFNVFLPINRNKIEPLSHDFEKETKAEPIENTAESAETTMAHPTHFTILLVEDNEDFRFYLRDNLKVHYNILEASNGKEALDIASQEMPDLIVSDLLMPVMDGLKFCAKLKQDKKISHIPFILLTASLTEEKRLEGFKVGADAYITKPFSFELLESRIRNLISQRDRNRKQYQENFKIEPGTIGITPLDEKLMKKALKIVEDNLNDTEFSVEKMSQELGFSRVHLYKKILSITGKSPVEFIRLVRLKRAAQLLRESQLTVSEIAYQVGFNDPRYFSKQFKSEFNMLPSRYKSEHTSKTPDIRNYFE